MKAANGNIHADPDAPAYARSEVMIEAPIDVVWKVMTDIDGWPKWNHDVKEATLGGELEVGTEFRWKAGPGTIVSTLRRVNAPESIAWTGRSFGVEAIHEWDLEDQGERTRLVTAESWDGLVAKVFRRSSRKALKKALRDGPRYLKAEAERLAAYPTERGRDGSR